MKKSVKFLLVIAIFSLGLLSCSDDNYFDKVKYEQLVSSAFPVDSVDKNQDWSIFATCNAFVNLRQSEGDSCDVKVYSENPMSNDTVTILVSERLANNATSQMSIQFEKLSPEVYFEVTDKDGYSAIFMRTLTEGNWTTSIGNNITQSSSAVKAKNKVNASAFVFATSSGYTSVNDIPNAKNYSDYGKNGDNKKGNYIVTAGKNIKINVDNEGANIFFGAGNYTLSNSFNVKSGSNVYILSGANVTTTSDIKFDGVIYNQGTIATSGKNIITGAKESQLINEGTINVGSLEIANSGHFLNIGTTNVSEDTKINSANCTWCNEGQYKTNKFVYKTDGESTDVINNCKLTVYDNLEIYLDNDGKSCFKLNGNAYIHTKDFAINSGILYMGDNSLMTITATTKLKTEASIISLAAKYALINSNKINSSDNKNNQPKLSGRLILAAENDYTEKYKKTDDVIQVKGQRCVNINIPPTTCSDGYQPTFPSNVEAKWESYRYCFEDNYPMPGDYDFNDCVMSIKKESSLFLGTLLGYQFSFKVSLDAVGATKQMAAAIRLKGIPRTSISDVTIKSGKLFDWNADLTGGGYNETILDESNFDEKYLSKKAIVDDAVIYLFNDAHYAMNNVKDGNYVKRVFYNTVSNGTIASAEKVTPKTCTIRITTKPWFSTYNFEIKDLDPFIIVEYNGSKWEVHTQNFKTDRVLFANGNANDYEEAYSNIYPWAICVPGYFKYPQEFQPIGTFKNGEDIGGAYHVNGHSFGEWAKDINKSKDWYFYPDYDKVY